MVNPTILFKIKGAWEKFSSNHPKFPMFLSAVGQKGIQADDVIEIKIIAKDGSNMCTNVKLTESDMELFQSLKEMTSK